MSNEEKQLLLIDLCARLPYRVKCADFKYDNNGNKIDTVEVLGIINPDYQNYSYLGSTGTHEISRIKPYLRPMSSMTMEEQREYISVGRSMSPDNPSALSDWLNENKFDYRGLIPMGLALEAPEGMYNF